MDRQNIRAVLRAQRQSLSTSQRADCSKNLLEILRSQSWYQSAQTIALYLRNDGELDLAPVIEDAVSQGKVITLPQVQPEKGEMLFRQWQPGEPLIKNRYEILEPSAGRICPLSSHSLILAPLVAIDSRGTRIGMGGGYYDRALNSSRNSAERPLVVGIAYDFQRLEELKREEWDARLDAVVTDKEVITISGHIRTLIESNLT